jgi:hypothetical protein
MPKIVDATFVGKLTEAAGSKHGKVYEIYECWESSSRKEKEYEQDYHL